MQDALDSSVPEVISWAQAEIARRIENPDPVSYLGGIRSRTEWVHDLAALTRLLLVTLDHRRFPPSFAEILQAKGIGAGDDVQRHLESWAPFIGLTAYRSPAARFSEALESPVTFATAASVAVCVMTSPERAAEQLRSLLPSATRRTAVRSSRQRGTSWLLTRALMGPGQSMTPGQVRSRRLAGELYRRDGSRRAPIPTSMIPARPWLGVRTAVPWIGTGPFAGLAATVTLLGVASTTHIGGLCRELGLDHLAQRVKYETGKLFRELVARGGEDVLDEFLALHDAVAAMAVPIDYERRRRVFANPKPLKQQTARQAARDLGLRPTDRLARFMSWWIWDQLTGNDVLLTLRLLELPGPVRAAYHRQRASWDREQPLILLRRAEHALLVNRIDEPISWSPVRHSDGTWDTSTAVPERQLDWFHRPGRRFSARTSADVSRMRDADVVALAFAGQTAATRRLALRLDRFYEFAQGPTVRVAAQRLGIQQQVLSRNIAGLEADLGRSLVERNHMSSTPNPAGVSLCRAILRARRREEIDLRRASATKSSNQRRGGR